MGRRIHAGRVESRPVVPNDFQRGRGTTQGQGHLKNPAELCSRRQNLAPTEGHAHVALHMSNQPRTWIVHDIRLDSSHDDSDQGWARAERAPAQTATATLGSSAPHRSRCGQSQALLDGPAPSAQVRPAQRESVLESGNQRTVGPNRVSNATRDPSVGLSLLGGHLLDKSAKPTGKEFVEPIPVAQRGTNVGSTPGSKRSDCGFDRHASGNRIHMQQHQCTEQSCAVAMGRSHGSGCAGSQDAVYLVYQLCAKASGRGERKTVCVAGAMRQA